MFQLTAARRRLVNHPISIKVCASFNSQPPEGGWAAENGYQYWRRSFNSQPPEGGWEMSRARSKLAKLFQLTAARRRLGVVLSPHRLPRGVSTHSRPKAAGLAVSHHAAGQPVSTHSRPKAAGFVNCCHSDFKRVSTHSRPKAAGCRPKRYRTP